MTGKASSPLDNILLDALSAPDDVLGMRLLEHFVQTQAKDLGIPTDAIPNEFGAMVVENILTLEANSAKDAAVEKALHLAAVGNFEKAGKFIREHLGNGADLIDLANLARKYVPIGIHKVKQAQEFGERGASENRAVGQKNREAVIAAAKDIIKNRTNPKRPTVRELAPAIARATDVSEPTVRKHLKKAELDKLWDQKKAESDKVLD